MDARYPIGKYDPHDATPIAEVIGQIAALPAELRRAAGAMTEKQLDTPYREGGWTARQVIHHLADSHVNSYVRCRLALTEDRPAIRPYDENKWAELPDGKSGPLEPSLGLIEALHARWVALLRTLTPEDFDRPLVHPERGEFSLGRMVRIYAWHGKHHLAHLELSRTAGA